MPGFRYEQGEDRKRYAEYRKEDSTPVSINLNNR